MSTLPMPTAGGDFEPIPAGTYPAICYRVIDLGTQLGEYQGEKKTQHKVLLSWEIADDQVRMADGRAFTISSRYTWSMHEKSKLRHVLEAWRGQAFTQADFGETGFDIKKLIDQKCMITLVEEAKDGKRYTNIASIAKLPRQMADACAPLMNKTAFIWLSKPLFDATAFSELSDNLKATIMKSPEWREATSAPQHPGETAGSRVLMDDDVPFGMEWR